MAGDFTIIDTGQLRHRVEIQCVVTQRRNDYGEFDNVWASPNAVVNAKQEVTAANPLKVWTRVENLGGRAQEIVRGIGLTSTHRVTMRYHPQLSTKCRLVYAGKVFTIDNLDDVDNRRIKHVALCSEFIEGDTR